MTRTEPTIDFSNPAANYERWLVDPLFRPFAGILIDQTGVTAGDRVLDVACGTGLVATMAADKTGDPELVVGVDLSFGMLSTASRNAPSIDWREGNANALPLHSGERFDVVLCHQGLQFFADRALAVSQMRQALRSGGRLGIATWAPVSEGLMHDLHLIAERHLGELVDRRHLFGKEGPMARLLENAGLQDVDVRTVTRRVTFPEPGVFLQLNSRSMVGMSLRAPMLSEREKTDVAQRIVDESVEAARAHTTADGVSFTIGSVIATARR